MKTYKKSLMILSIVQFIFVFSVEAQFDGRSNKDDDYDITSIPSTPKSPSKILQDTASSTNSSKNFSGNVRPDSLKSPPSAHNGTVLFCGPNSICEGVPTPGVPPPEISDPPKPKIFEPKHLQKMNNNSSRGGFNSDSINTKNYDFSFSYVVALLLNGRVTCSGVLISKNKILTAAHCLCGSEKPDKMFLGSSIYTGDTSDVGYKLRAELSNEIELFNEDFCEQYKSNDKGIVSKQLIDLGIISTMRDIQLPDNYFFQPINLSHNLRDTQQFLIVGFGASNNFNAGGVKRYAKVNAAICDASNMIIGGCIEDLEIVAINKKGDSVDTCKGDSGGPLITMDQSAILKLTGITSRKISQGIEKYCGSGGVYINLTAPSIQNWLNNKLIMFSNKGSI